MVVVALTLVACSDESRSSTPPATPPPDGGTVVGCSPGERPLEDGSCQPAGVRPESCADGFQPDDDRGCTPILPATSCADGLMAVPGETECREVAPCGDAPWGDIPVDGDTQYVDAAYAGTDSDGTARRPWTTILAAVTAAADGAVVAIAAGSYVEDVKIYTKPVRLWGRCPALVEIVGTDLGQATVGIRTGGDGAELHTLAITGPMTGVAMSGAQDVVVDRVWLHHNERAAMAVERTLGAASVTIEGSLIEHALEYGIFADSVDVTLSRSVIRDTLAGARAPGRGFNVQTREHLHVPVATITSSILERNTELGIFVFASQLTLENSLVQDTQPNGLDRGGRGLDIEDDDETGDRSLVFVRSSVLQRNMDIQVTCTGSDLMMESTSLRDTLPMKEDGSFGRGFSSLDRAGRANVLLRESVIIRSHDIAAIIDGSDATFESLYIRDVGPQMSTLTHGRGLGVQYGVGERGNLTVRWSAIEGARDAGISAIESDLRVESTLVRGIAASEAGDFGDGIAVVTIDHPANAWIVGSRIEGSARAGISSFGATVEISATRLECNPIQLDAEPSGGKAGALFDAGEVVCGCAAEEETCTVRSAMLAPPDPLETQE